MSIFEDHRNPKLGDNAWMRANPGRYAVYRNPIGGWHVTKDMKRVDLCADLPDAMDAAYADANTQAMKEPS